MGIERKNIHHAAQKDKGRQVHENGQTCFPLNSVSSFPCTYCRNVVRERAGRREKKTPLNEKIKEMNRKKNNISN